MHEGGMQAAVLSYPLFLRQLTVAITLPLCVLHVRRCGQRHPPGTARLLAASPALLFVFLAPLLFTLDEPLSLITVAFHSQRLPATKMLAFCLGRGTLSIHLHTLTARQFVASTLLPLVLMPRNNNGHPSHLVLATPSSLLSTLSMKAAVLSFLPLLARVFRAVVGAGAGSQLVPALGMYCAMSGLLDMTLLLSLDLGLPLAMPFNWPHLSASLSEFWGRRWNLSQSDLLKDLVYRPIVEGRLFVAEQQSERQAVGQQQPGQKEIEGDTADPSRSQQAARGLQHWLGADGVRILALWLTFMFSGIEHLVFYWYITRRICLSWLGFFTVHGFLLVAELLSRRAWQLFPASSSQSHFATGSSLESGLRLTGKGAQIFVTVSILLVTGELWFFGPLLEPELVDRVSRSLLWWKAGSH